MSKRIELTWHNHGKVVVEECLLVEDDDPIYVMGVPLVMEGGIEGCVGTISGGYVMFEDDDGLFGVPPQHVVHIKMLD